jgi:pimeloyl-ACP methyl ester carboxylesterase
VVLNALGDRSELVVVGQSLGAFTAPLVCAHRDVRLLVLLNPMIPTPGETGEDWWVNTNHPVRIGPDFDPVEVFLHDAPPDVIRESASHVSEQSSAPMRDPWPLHAWPDVPTRIIASRDDRFFPVAGQRQVAQKRLGILPDEMAGGHCVALSRPRELAELLERLRRRYARTEDSPAAAGPLSARFVCRVIERRQHTLLPGALRSARGRCVDRESSGAA